MNNSHPIEHIEAVETALYFRTVSVKIFTQTKFPGAVNRPSFNMKYGANYSSPFKEWSLKSEQILFLRHDTLTRLENGSVMRVAVFRTAKPKIAHYRSKQRNNTGMEMNVFQKFHDGKYFFGASHIQRIMDGTVGPRQDDPYHLVFEVRRDGGAHPDGWSRLPTIGPFEDWDEARALAVRIEWEYPPKSGQFRFRYMHTRKVYTFQDKAAAGSNVNYIRSIAMTRWLFNADLNNTQPWVPKLRGCAYVLQTHFNLHNQTIEVRAPSTFTMKSGAFRSPATTIAQMTSEGLSNANGQFGGNVRRSNCDTCALMLTAPKKELGECVQVQHSQFNVCKICVTFGRPACSWTQGEGLKGSAYYTDKMIVGTAGRKAKVSSEDVVLNSNYTALLIAQPLPEKEQTGTSFPQQLLDLVGLARREDDLSDAEDEDSSELVDEEGY